MPILQPSASLQLEVLAEAARVREAFTEDAIPMPDREDLAAMATPEHVAVAVRAVDLFRRLAAKGFDGEYFDSGEESLLQTTCYGLDSHTEEALTRGYKQKPGQRLNVELFAHVEAGTHHDFSAHQHKIVGRQTLAVFESYQPGQAVIVRFGNVAYVGPRKVAGVTPGGIIGNLAYAPSNTQLTDIRDTLDFIETAAVASGMKPEPAPESSVEEAPAVG